MLFFFFRFFLSSHCSFLSGLPEQAERFFFFDLSLFLLLSGCLSTKSACLQAWRIAHPPRRGTNWLGTRPLVHVGFLKSWLAGGLKYKVVDHILGAVRQCKAESKSEQPVTVFVTGMQNQVSLRPRLILAPPPPPLPPPPQMCPSGQTCCKPSLPHMQHGKLTPSHPPFGVGHSLGGALATLAAFDIQKQLLAANQRDARVVCYTFAAPRTGNHAFAREYNAVVPDTWSVINDQVVGG